MTTDPTPRTLRDAIAQVVSDVLMHHEGTLSDREEIADKTTDMLLASFDISPHNEPVGAEIGSFSDNELAARDVGGDSPAEETK